MNKPANDLKSLSLRHLPLFDDNGILRPYQKEFIEKTRASYREGNKIVMSVLPTGAGKTVTAVCLPREGARVMVIVRDDPLVPQWIGSIRHFRRSAVSVEQADEVGDVGDCWVVAMFQSLVSNGRYRKYLGKVDLIVVDECDVGFTQAFRDMMMEFVAAGARILGLTATPYRGDKASLFGFYEAVPYCLELRDCFRDGWLVEPRVMLHEVKSYNFAQLSKTRVDYKPLELAGMLEQEAVLHEVANLIKTHHKQFGMVRCKSVRQAQKIAEILSERYGINAGCVWGTMPDAEREEQFKKFSSGENTIITSCRLLGRGWDEPSVREIYNASPTKNKSVFVQALGRGTRALTGVINNQMTREERLAAIASSEKPSWVWHDLGGQSSRVNTPVTAIDVLLNGPKEIIQRVIEKAQEEELPLGEIDSLMAEEIKLAEEAERLAREEEKARRRGVVVGVTFESSERDLFATPDRKEAKVRGWRMPFGRYRGMPLKDPQIPLHYLQWALREGRLNAMWTAAVSQEIERREAKDRAVDAGREPVTPW